jgi:coenzyme F420 hydrogenase subunit beta
VPYAWDELGVVREVLMARSTDAQTRSRAQYGGTVTALTCFALAEGLIDSAVLTASQDKSLPEAVIVSTKEGVLNCAGSSYIATPTLEAFNQGAQDINRNRIGVIGTPCQVLALAKMRASTLDNRNNIDKLSLVIGLFCTWALAHDGFSRLLKDSVSMSDVVKLDIPPPPANTFEIYTMSQRISLPLDEVRNFILSTCTYCIDMTAEFSDISVGAVEGINGWNTVIIRTERGSDLVKAAKDKGIIETAMLPSQNLGHLKEASVLKKKRALSNIINKTGSVNDFLYLQVQGNRVNKLLER